MKAYFALNEAGTAGDIALHTKIAVTTARDQTDLELTLLYTGNRNDFTAWLEAHGVQVIDSKLPYLHLLERLTAEGRYHLMSVGHWLRTNVPLEEKDSDFLVYTDIDVVFQGGIPTLDSPSYFSAAPEFKKDGWNYFNAGVMYVNVRSMRDTYDSFEEYLYENISARTVNFHDQIAYNEFYRGKWERLPVDLNWKPFWGINNKAPIVHFHGPKLGAIDAILDDRWDWSNKHGVQIGSLFSNNIESYEFYIARIMDIRGLSDEDYAFINAILVKIRNAREIIGNKPSDLSFTDYKMFPE